MRFFMSLCTFQKFFRGFPDFQSLELKPCIKVQKSWPFSWAPRFSKIWSENFYEEKQLKIFSKEISSPKNFFFNQH